MYELPCLGNECHSKGSPRRPLQGGHDVEDTIVVHQTSRNQVFTQGPITLAGSSTTMPQRRERRPAPSPLLTQHDSSVELQPKASPGRVWSTTMVTPATNEIVLSTTQCRRRHQRYSVQQCTCPKQRPKRKSEGNTVRCVQARQRVDKVRGNKDFTKGKDQIQTRKGRTKVKTNKSGLTITERNDHEGIKRGKGS